MASFGLMPMPVSTKGRIVSPIELRYKAKIKPRRSSKAERLEAEAYRLVQETKKKSKKGWVKAFMACPVKGFFKPMKSPSTDTLWRS
jgi:hypothetical protein